MNNNSNACTPVPQASYSFTQILCLKTSLWRPGTSLLRRNFILSEDSMYSFTIGLKLFSKTIYQLTTEK